MSAPFFIHGLALSIWRAYNERGGLGIYSHYDNQPIMAIMGSWNGKSLHYSYKRAPPSQQTLNP